MGAVTLAAAVLLVALVLAGPATSPSGAASCDYPGGACEGPDRMEDRPDWKSSECWQLPPTTVLCNTEKTIRVEIGTTGTEDEPNGWGGAITGIWYRSCDSESCGSWGTNMIDNTAPGMLLQPTLREGPISEDIRFGCIWKQILRARANGDCTEPDEPAGPWNPTPAGGHMKQQGGRGRPRR
jgi:hypothetical protein